MNQTELHATAEAVVAIEVIVECTKSDQVTSVNGAAEPFEGIVVTVGHLYIFDDRAASDTTHRQTIELGVRLRGDAGKLNADILENAT